MKRTVLLLTSLTAAVFLFGGVALALAVSCEAGVRVCYGTNAADTVTGTPGHDRIHARNGNDDVHAHGSHDYVKGDRGDDVLYGGIGNDKVDGGQGYDVSYGGEGNDPAVMAEKAYGGTGEDTLWGDFLYLGEVVVVAGGPGNDILYGTYTYDDESTFKETLKGGRGADRIKGSSLDDAIYGGPGQDNIVAYNGDDTIDVQDDERDRVQCGSGQDIVYVDRVDSYDEATCEEIHPAS